MPTATSLLRDPEWPEGTLLDPAQRHLLGTGAGGRRYQILETSGPWGSTLFIKDFGPKGKVAAAREFQWHKKLRERGLSVPRPWLITQLQGSWQFLMQDCSGETPLSRMDVLSDTNLQKKIANSVHALHDAGFEHGDLHLGNVLRDPGGKLYWTDFRRTKVHQKISESNRFLDWGHFLAALLPASPGQLSSLLESFSGAKVRKIIDAGWQRFRSHQCNLDRRARRILHGLHPTVIREPIPNGSLTTPGQNIKASPRSTVTRLSPLKSRPLIRKEWRTTRLLDCRDLLGRSKAIRSMLAAESLMRRKFRTAKPIAAGSHPRSGSWLLLEDLGSLPRLQDALKRGSPQQQSKLLHSLGIFCLNLHQAGVWYRDLKPSNILVDVDRSGNQQFVMIDNDRNRFSRSKISRSRGCKDIAALLTGFPDEINTKQRLDFLREYDSFLLSSHGATLLISLDREIRRRRLARKLPPLPSLKEANETTDSP